MKPINRFVLMLGLLVMGSLLVTACSSSSAPSATATATPQPTQQATKTETPTPAPTAAPVTNAAAQQAEQALANELGLAMSDISVKSVESVSWPNSCLGVELPGTMCAMHVTDGYRVTLEANGQAYEYHTNGDGSDVAAALALTWHREGGVAGFCNDLVIDVTGMMTAYSCEGQPPTKVNAVLLNPEPRQQLYDWLDSYQSFTWDQTDPAQADSMTTQLTFNGRGTTAATSDNIQAVAAFASQFYSQISLTTAVSPALVAEIPLQP